MKPRLLCVLLLSGLAALADTKSAQAPSLSVRTLSSARRTAVVSAGTDGSFSKDIDRTCSIEIKMVPFSVPETGFDLEWFFVAKTVTGKGRWIYDAGSKHSAKGREEMKVQSLPVQAQSDRQVDVGLAPVMTPEGRAIKWTTVVTEAASGSKYEGWVVRVKSGGTVVRVEASLSELREMALSNPEVFDKALGRDVPPPAPAAAPAQ
jgi:hypothetical protein